MMMEGRPEKELRDPIHGFIPVYGHELEIIQDPVFQRLRRIKQLSFGHLVYHGAEHSRFGHALGVMHSAGTALSQIAENCRRYGLPASIDVHDVKLVRIAALLHDVGHYPFSHALDDAGIIGEGHEAYSQSLVEGHFAGIIEASGIDPESVSRMIRTDPSPERPFLMSVVNSQIDADKFDYLLRDSHYAGVKYGVYDLDRLRDTLAVKDDRLVVLSKGVFAAEQFLLARHMMFGQVYTHKTKRCFEGIAKAALRHLVKSGDFVYPSTRDLRDEKTVEDFTALDDAWLLKQIGRTDAPGGPPWNSAIMRREPFKMIVSSDGVAAALRHKSEDGASYLKGIFEGVRSDLASGSLRSHGIREEDVVLDEGKYVSYKISPYKKRPLGVGSTRNDDQITVYDPDSRRSEPIEDRSRLIRELASQHPYRRIYAHSSRSEALREFLSERHADLGL